MKEISFSIPEPYLKDIDLLIKQGKYPSRAELIRLAVRDLLLKQGFAPWEKGQK